MNILFIFILIVFMYINKYNHPLLEGQDIIGDIRSRGFIGGKPSRRGPIGRKIQK